MGFSTHDGTQVTSLQITRAFWAGQARIQVGYGNAIGLRLDGADVDTRGTEPLMSCQVWTRLPIDLNECMEAAGGNPAWREEQAQINAETAAVFAELARR